VVEVVEIEIVMEVVVVNWLRLLLVDKEVQEPPLVLTDRLVVSI
jgi:hypothetical protein